MFEGVYNEVFTKIFGDMEGVQEDRFKYFEPMEKFDISVNFIEGGAVVPDHTHEQDVYNYVFEGEFLVNIGGENSLLKQGDWTSIPKGVVHSVEAKAPVALLELWRK